MPSGIYERKRTAEMIKDIMLQENRALSIPEIRRYVNNELSKVPRKTPLRPVSYQSIKIMINDLKLTGLVEIEESQEIEKHGGGTALRHYYKLVNSEINNDLWNNPQQARKDMQK